MSGLTVNIVYRDKEMNKVNEMNYDFQSYLEIRRYELISLLGEIEDMMKAQTGTNVRENWNKDALEKFNHVRHKLLDEANSLKRLPQNMLLSGKHVYDIPSGQMVAEIINAFK